MARSVDTMSVAKMHGPVTRALAAMRVEPEPQPERRGFLRGLLALPLIGGAVSLIGAPTAVAEPASKQLLREYHDWLMYERFQVAQELDDDDPSGLGPHATFGAAWRWHRARGKIREGSQSGEMLGDGVSFPSTRAALVMSAVGCDWRA